MAQEEQKKIYTIELDISDLTKDAAQLNTILERQNEQLKQMKRNGETGTKAYVQLQTAQRKIKTELSSTNKQIDNQNKLNQSLEGSNDQLRAKLALLSKQYNALSREQRNSKEVGGQLQKEIKNLNDELKANESAVGDNRRNVGNYKDALSSVGGPMAGVVAGIGNMTKAALAFIATPLGVVLFAIVGALAAVKTAFTSSEEGQNKFAKITSVVNALLGNLLDLVADVGEAIIEAFENPQETIDNIGKMIKENISNRFEGLTELIPQLGKAINLLFEGEFAEAGKVATNAVAKVTLGVEDFTDKVDDAIQKTKEFVDENINEANAAARVADMRAEAERIERNLLIERAQLESRIAELRLKAREEDQYNAQERKAFLSEAMSLQDDLLQREKQFLILRRDAQILENTFSRTNIENKRKEAEAIAAVSQKEAERFNQARTIAREVLRVDNEIARNKEKALKDEQKALEDLNAIRDEIHKSNLSKEDLEILKVSEKYDKMFQKLQELKLKEDELRQIEKELIAAQEAEITAIQIDQAEKRKEAALKAESEKKKAAEEAARVQIGAAVGVTQQVAGLAKDNVAAQKGASASSAIASTYEGAAAALAPPPKGAGPILGPALATATILNGLSSVANILQAARGGVIQKFGRGGSPYMNIIGGRPHSQGGTKFFGEDGSAFEAEKGELIAVVNKHNTSLLGKLSDLNSYGGHGDPFHFARGGTFLQDGGLAARANAGISTGAFFEEVVRAIREMPPGQIEVVEIASGLRNAEVVENLRTL